MSAATATMPNPFASKAVVGGTGEYETCPAGNKPARLIAIVDLGTFNEELTKDDGTKHYKDIRKLAMFWQLTTTKQKNGQPFIIGERYSYSSAMTSKAKLRLMLQGWQGHAYPEGEPIDPTAFLERDCLVNVAHTKSKDGQKTYANISSISPPFEGFEVPPLTRPALCYHMSQGDAPDLTWLPYIYGQKITDIMAESKERAGKAPQPAASASAYTNPPMPAGTTVPNDLDVVVKILRAVASQPEKQESRVAACDEAQRIMQQASIMAEHLPDDVRGMVTPF